MRTPKRKGYQSVPNDNITYEAEPLEMMLRRATEENLPIEETAPTIFTPRGMGVMPEYDIRTDRFEVAREGMDKYRKLQEIERMNGTGVNQVAETGDTTEENSEE